MDDVDRLLTHVGQVLGDPAQWRNPEGYPTSLALCLIDSIYSLGITYEVTGAVVGRYRRARVEEGGDPGTDTASDLVAFVERNGGAQQFAEFPGTKNLTSTGTAGVLKAVALDQAAHMFVAIGVETPRDLLTAAADPEVRAAWHQIPGQRSSSTGWRYLLLLAGAEEVKPDRMIKGFVGRAVGRRVGSEEAARLVHAAALRGGHRARVLDHAI